ncbi:MAG: PDZ domain-containing protein [Candidatus Aureabacteria bacterium]|nr:PDZ domain-containing protein [Candidatus Auribacterota bacterium]NLW93798.1 PDZ domain-containing protein [Chlamydiota bacterium]HOE26475.1 PDZ domain-containing protein [bacterium]HQM52756.1 PDZ domain-containing protein [bacterium]
MKTLFAALLILLAAVRADAGGKEEPLLARMGRELERFAAAVRPSVVQVIAECDPSAQGAGFEGGMRGRGGIFRAATRRSGSGFFISRDGHILTTAYVVRAARRIVVRLDDGAEHEARLCGSDPGLNAAVLGIEGARRNPPPLGDSDRLRPGSFVFAIGNPFGLAGSVIPGVVAERGRTVPEIAELAELLQVSASINPGDSGAPLVDAGGEVVGILAASMGGPGDAGDAPQGICFAVPLNAVKGALPALMAGEEIERGWLGVGVQELTPALQAEFGVLDGRGVMVARVIEGGPAAAAGVRSGDVVRAFDGAPVRSPRELIARVAAAPAGSDATLVLMRNGREETLSVRIGRRAVSFAPMAEGETSRGLGLVVGEAEPGEDGAAVEIREVRPGSPAARAGLRPGDRILEANRKRVSGPEEWEAAVGRSGVERILVRTQRGFFVIRGD